MFNLNLNYSSGYPGLQRIPRSILCVENVKFKDLLVEDGGVGRKSGIEIEEVEQSRALNFNLNINSCYTITGAPADSASSPTLFRYNILALNS